MIKDCQPFKDPGGSISLAKPKSPVVGVHLADVGFFFPDLLIVAHFVDMKK